MTVSSFRFQWSQKKKTKTKKNETMEKPEKSKQNGIIARIHAFMREWINRFNVFFVKLCKMIVFFYFWFRFQFHFGFVCLVMRLRQKKKKKKAFCFFVPWAIGHSPKMNTNQINLLTCTFSHMKTEIPFSGNERWYRNMENENRFFFRFRF